MALLFCDGWDHYTTPSQKWDLVLGGTISGASARFGAGGVNMNGESTYLAKTLAPSGATAIAGVAMYKSSFAGQFSTEDMILSFVRSGTRQIGISVDNTGKLHVVRNTGVIGSSTLTLSTNVWYYIELKTLLHTSSGGTVEVRVNGVTWITLSGVTTASTAADWNTLYLNGHRAGQRYDDLYVCDGSGSSPTNTFLGDVRIESIFPTGNGNSSQFDGSDGNSTDNYALVDEAAPSTADYVESSDVGDKDTYGFTNVSPSAGTVYGIQIMPFAAKTDAGVRSIASVARSGGSEVDSSDKPLSVTPIYLPDMRETKPGGGSWTISDINAAEFGVKVTA